MKLEEIKLVIDKILNTQPGDFLLATKQEDYLTYRISSELTSNSIDSYFPTQFKRVDIAEINSKNASVVKLIEAKYHYSSDFSELFDYGEKCTRKDFEKLARVSKDYDKSEKFLLQFVIHFSEKDITKWEDYLIKPKIQFESNLKYFTYLNNADIRRFRRDLKFRNKKENHLYSKNFENYFIDEVKSYGLPDLNIEGNLKFDLSNATIMFDKKEFQIPHCLHCFLWKIQSVKY